ncbi:MULTISPECIES: hypothetical protein [unclassified Streptomyces]|uniref:hypothetical protein n=1 Tax=unclassified Streptomyces TaxID=2593676 RepID=UPI002E80B67E|nr:hypothetical protein [Streptomyces sp. NBC_00589]WTI33630.1 hypothetical protein OIC96_00655 [Streptomyces sp. NBC_00775]WUB32698.1 hypothetical protein OHA51_49080 [Streptomyces sp. NBC_00589]
MLASLLPGLRELRTPLAVGYLYALSLYLLLLDSIPTKVKDEGNLKPLYDVAHWLGKPAVLAAGAFLAYLIGSVLVVRATTLSRGIITAFLKVFDRFRRDTFEASTDDEDALDTSKAMGELTSGAIKNLWKYSGDRINRKLRPRPSEEALFHLVNQAMDHLLRDLPQLRTRLYTASKDMYGDYDRLAAEADLKANVGLAGIVLGSVMTAQVHGLWVLLWVPMGFLGYRGLSTARQANDYLVQAVVTDLVKSPSFEEFIDALGPSTEARPDPDYRGRTCRAGNRRQPSSD